MGGQAGYGTPDPGPSDPSSVSGVRFGNTGERRESWVLCPLPKAARLVSGVPVSACIVCKVQTCICCIYLDTITPVTAWCPCRPWHISAIRHWMSPPVDFLREGHDSRYKKKKIIIKIRGAKESLQHRESCDFLLPFGRDGDRAV